MRFLIKTDPRFAKGFLLVALPLIFMCNSAFGQELVHPSKGKAIVYFTRITSLGVVIDFKLYDGDTYIGKIFGREYLVYECDPGEHLFWAGSENRDFLPAYLEKDKIYFVDAAVKVGGFKARVDLLPITDPDEKVLKKLKKLLTKKDPVTFSDKELKDVQESKAGYIEKSLLKYQEQIEKDKEFENLEEHMDSLTI